MLVKLSKITATSKPVRKTRDVKKMDELVASIKEQGVIVPPKLRANSNGYDVVYGHRRVDAARLAGLKEIECVVQDVADDKLTIQGLTENIVREDMTALDVGKALTEIKEKTGWPNKRIGAAFGWSERYIGQCLEVVEYETELELSSLGTGHISQAKAGTDGDKVLVTKVLKKAGREVLTEKETRKLADTVTDARKFGGQKAVARVLNTPYETLKHVEPEYAPPKRKLAPVQKNIVFSWVRDERVIRGDEGVKAIGVAIKAMELQYEKDPGSALAMLKRYKSTLVTLVARVDKAIEVVEHER